MISTDSPVLRRTAVSDAHGIHLRPAVRFVEAAQRYAATIRVRCNGAEANGKSIMDLLCLAASFGATVELEARGPDAEEAVMALAELIAAGSHAPSGAQAT